MERFDAHQTIEGDVDRRVNRDRQIGMRRLLDHPQERPTVDVLHRDVQNVANASRFEHLHDVRAVDCGRELRLVTEAADELLLAGELGVEPLDYDWARDSSPRITGSSEPNVARGAPSQR